MKFLGVHIVVGHEIIPQRRAVGIQHDRCLRAAAFCRVKQQLGVPIYADIPDTKKLGACRLAMTFNPEQFARAIGLLDGLVELQKS